MAIIIYVAFFIHETLHVSFSVQTLAVLAFRELLCTKVRAVYTYRSAPHQLGQSKGWSREKLAPSGFFAQSDMDTQKDEWM
jgi:hypothetical protein